MNCPSGEIGPEPAKALGEDGESPAAADSAPSIHDLVPDEPGGEEARRGFLFQDHVAAGFYLEMAEDESLTTVWCEADDDVTLVWQAPRAAGTGDAELGLDAGGDTATAYEVEFVQVKGNEHDQL